MRNLLRTLASVSLKAKLSSSWWYRFDDGWSVEVADIDLNYWRNSSPDNGSDIENKHTAGLTLTLLNFHIDFTVSWETL